MLKTAGVVVAIVAGIASVYGVAHEIQKSNDLKLQDRAAKWKSVFVYEAIRSQGSHGATFPDIRKGYVTFAQQYWKELGLASADIADPELRAALLALISEKAVVPTLDDRYMIYSEEFVSDRDPGPRMFAEEAIAAKASELVQKSPHVYNVEALTLEVQKAIQPDFPRETNLTFRIGRQIKGGLERNYIDLDEDNKLIPGSRAPNSVKKMEKKQD